MCLPLHLDIAGLKEKFACNKARIKAYLDRASRAVFKTLTNNYDGTFCQNS